jgi:hypothetical protein
MASKMLKWFMLFASIAIGVGLWLSISRDEPPQYEFLRNAEFQKTGLTPTGKKSLIYAKQGSYDEVYDEVKQELLRLGYEEVSGLGFFGLGHGSIESVHVYRENENPFFGLQQRGKPQMTGKVVIYTSVRENTLLSRIKGWIDGITP